MERLGLERRSVERRRLERLGLERFCLGRHCLGRYCLVRHRVEQLGMELMRARRGRQAMKTRQSSHEGAVVKP
jgi:hypothetical protein